MIYLREALMTGKRLPYDAEVEYLDSSGGQYIDTGMFINLYSDKIICDATSLSNGSDQFSSTAGLFGNRVGNNYIATVYNFYYALYYSNGINNFARWDGYMPTEYHRLRLRYIASRFLRRIELNGTALKESTTTTNVNYAFTNSCLLFAVRDSANVMINTRGTRVWMFQFYRNDELVLDLIPVRVGSGASAVGYMYDRVSGELFGNAGTGAFVIGPDASAANGGGV